MSAAHDHRPSEPCGQVHRIQGFHNLFKCTRLTSQEVELDKSERQRTFEDCIYAIHTDRSPPNVIVKRKEIFLESGKPNRTFSNIQIVWNLEYECSGK